MSNEQKADIAFQKIRADLISALNSGKKKTILIEVSHSRINPVKVSERVKKGDDTEVWLTTFIDIVI